MIERALRIEPVSPPAGAVVYELDEGQPQPTGGMGGWAERARPRRRSFTEWEGHGLYHLPIAVVLDRGGRPDGEGPDVEQDVSALAGLALVVPGAGQPPVLALSGPIAIPAPLWVVNDIVWGAYERRVVDGARIRQHAVVEFWEYDAPDLVVVVSPAQAAADRQAAAEAAPAAPASAPSQAPPRTHAVTAGQTLSGIASSVLGDHRRWQEIADLNGIRDPRRLKVGQVLRL